MRLPRILNEPLKHYAPGSEERAKLASALKELLQTTFDVPCVVDGQRVFTDRMDKQGVPADRDRVLCNYSTADAKLTQRAVQSAVQGREEWERWPLKHKAAIFFKAADLLSSDQYRYKVMAATMLGQGKNAWQAEIDAAAEMCDFWRFNVQYYAQALSLLQDTIRDDAARTWNRVEGRGLEGFVLAISPFNFTSIGGNLASAPALCGNTVIWKPSSAAVLSNYLLLEILEDAGLPPGVIQFLPGRPADIVGECVGSEHLAGIHFTGSTTVFRSIWQQVAGNIAKYRTFPRLVGETGGKNFHLVHHSADPEHVLHSTLRAAYEYQGQKCSACSRLYVPMSMWRTGGLRDKMVGALQTMTIARQPEDLLHCFLGPMINEDAVKTVKAVAGKAKGVLYGGEVLQDAKGWSVTPMLIESKSATAESMTEELFAPILTVHPYPDAMKWADVVDLVNSTSKYGLTGSIFAKDRAAIDAAMDGLRHAAGNVYINDKCTGAVVGQQPFGGARASGTNDKAGSALNLLRWTSPLAVKEGFSELTDHLYASNRL